MLGDNVLNFYEKQIQQKMSGLKSVKRNAMVKSSVKIVAVVEVATLFYEGNT